MKTNLKLAKVDGEYKLVNIVEVSNDQSNLPQRMSLEELLHRHEETIRMAVKDRKEHCYQSLLDHAKHDKIAYEDRYSYWYKDGGCFSKRAYACMEEVLSNIENGEIEMCLNEPYKLSQILKALYMIGASQTKQIATLANILFETFACSLSNRN